MGTSVRFYVLGEPVAKGRPRTRIVWTPGKRPFATIYTPAKSRKYESRVRTEAKLAMRAVGLKMFRGPVKVAIWLMFGIPQSYSVKERERCLAGVDFHTKRPDIDNAAKSIMDALNDVVFADDSQIVELACHKGFAAKAHTWVAVEAITPAVGPLFAGAAA